MSFKTVLPKSGSQRRWWGRRFSFGRRKTNSWAFGLNAYFSEDPSEQPSTRNRAKDDPLPPRPDSARFPNVLEDSTRILATTPVSSRSPASEHAWNPPPPPDDLPEPFARAPSRDQGSKREKNFLNLDVALLALHRVRPSVFRQLSSIFLLLSSDGRISADVICDRTGAARLDAEDMLTEAGCRESGLDFDSFVRIMLSRDPSALLDPLEPNSPSKHHSVYKSLSELSIVPPPSTSSSSHEYLNGATSNNNNNTWSSSNSNSSNNPNGNSSGLGSLAVPTSLKLTITPPFEAIRNFQEPQPKRSNSPPRIQGLSANTQQNTTLTPPTRPNTNTNTTSINVPNNNTPTQPQPPQQQQANGLQQSVTWQPAPPAELGKTISPQPPLNQSSSSLSSSSLTATKPSNKKPTQLTHAASRWLSEPGPTSRHHLLFSLIAVGTPSMLTTSDLDLGAPLDRLLLSLLKSALTIVPTKAVSLAKFLLIMAEYEALTDNMFMKPQRVSRAFSASQLPSMEDDVPLSPSTQVLKMRTFSQNPPNHQSAGSLLLLPALLAANDTPLRLAARLSRTLARQDPAILLLFRFLRLNETTDDVSALRMLLLVERSMHDLGSVPPEQIAHDYELIFALQRHLYVDRSNVLPPAAFLGLLRKYHRCVLLREPLKSDLNHINLLLVTNEAGATCSLYELELRRIQSILSNRPRTLKNNNNNSSAQSASRSAVGDPHKDKTGFAKSSGGSEADAVELVKYDKLFGWIDIGNTGFLFADDIKSAMQALVDCGVNEGSLDSLQVVLSIVESARPQSMPFSEFVAIMESCGDIDFYLRILQDSMMLD